MATGVVLATAGYGQEIRFWDVRTGKSNRQVRGRVDTLGLIALQEASYDECSERVFHTANKAPGPGGGPG